MNFLVFMDLGIMLFPLFGPLYFIKNVRIHSRPSVCPHHLHKTEIILGMGKEKVTPLLFYKGPMV